MKTHHTLFTDRPIAAAPTSDLFQFADQVEREGWLDTSFQLVLALCLAGSLAICGWRVAVPHQNESVNVQPAATTLAVGASETKTAPAL